MGSAKVRDEGRFGIGGNVRMAREARGLSMEDLAQRLGLAVAGVKDVEANRRRPTDRELESLVLVLRFPPAFFFRPDQPAGRFEPLFCGEDIVACQRCEYVADYLCDFPTGRGETCDLPLCERHAIDQAGDIEDIHFCPQHSIMARGLANARTEKGQA